jgi:hypothetical protein
VRELGGFPFYQPPLAVKPDDAVVLREVLSEARTFPPFSGEKLCGGFHPDFALEWNCGGSSCYSLLCFGCVEVVSIAPGVVLRTDLAREAFVRLYNVLHLYRVSRPSDAHDRAIETSVRMYEVLHLHRVIRPEDLPPEIREEIRDAVLRQTRGPE